MHPIHGLQFDSVVALNLSHIVFFEKGINSVCEFFCVASEVMSL
jgi:hypothetical protein